MNNKGVIIGVIVAVILLALLGWWWMSAANSNEPNPTGQQNNSTQTETKGTVFISVTDAAANMGAVSAVNMTVDKIYLHSQAEGWVEISQGSKTFSLLELKSDNRAELLAKADLDVDTYDQVWFHVSKVTVTESGTTKEATMPSKDFKMGGAINVMADASTRVELDVLADVSLHKTAKNEFIFAPVVKLESRSNTTVNVDSSNMVTVSGGNVDSSTSSGMDINGEVKTNFQLDANAVLEIKSGLINIK